VSLDDIDDALAEWQLWEQHWESQAMRWEPYWDQPALPYLEPGSLAEIMRREGVDGYSAQAIIDRSRRHVWMPSRDIALIEDNRVPPGMVVLVEGYWDEVNALWAQITEEMNRAFEQMTRQFLGVGRLFAGLLTPEPEPEPTGDPLRDLAAQAVHDDADLTPPPVDPERITCHGGEPWAPRRPRRPLDEDEQRRRYGMLVDERIAMQVVNPQSFVRISGI
jgi:hypothetical protein